MTNIKTLRIVVAEDDEINLFVLMKIIKDSGHIGIEFPDGHLAWDYLQQNPVDVDMVILDKMMVQMQGLEVVRRMKEHLILKNTPIIMQSGDAQPEKVKEAINVGIDSYITKPFDELCLVKAINKIAEEHQY